MNPYNSPDYLVNRLTSSIPQLRNNPNAQHMLDVVRRGDAKSGEQIADNICRTMGVSREDAYNRAKAFFSNMFGGML